METIEFLAVISIAIMCWLFCTFCFFAAALKEGDNIFVATGKLILAILLGWLVTPIILGANSGLNNI